MATSTPASSDVQPAAFNDVSADAHAPPDAAAPVDTNTSHFPPSVARADTASAAVAHDGIDLAAAGSGKSVPDQGRNLRPQRRRLRLRCLRRRRQ